jgi:hypothetical protein
MMTMMLSITSNSVGTATLTSNLIILLSALFGGLILNVKTTPESVAWVRSLDYFYYAFEALMANELVGMKLAFDPGGIEGTAIFFLCLSCFSDLLGMYCEKRIELTDSHCCWLPGIEVKGELFLEALNLRSDAVGEDVFFLFLLVVGYGTMAFLALTCCIPDACTGGRSMRRCKMLCGLNAQD